MKTSSILPLVLMTAVLATATASTGSAQIPDKFTNLKVLPKDTTREQLVPIMRSFANAAARSGSGAKKDTSSPPPRTTASI